MKSVRLFVCYAFAFVITACGVNIDESDSDSTDESLVTEVGAEDPSGELNPGSEDSIIFRGFVASAFEVTVDGTRYADMESYYTEELDQLPERVYDAGYTEDYEITFDAEVGLSDLWNEMTVFIAPRNDKGYQTSTKMNHSGGFSVQIPIDSHEDEYQVRANKRINIILSRPGESITICYNFSAIDQSVQLSEADKPIILDTFSTRITKYECENASSSGLQIPETEAVNYDYGQIDIGMDKKAVIEALGGANMQVEDSNRWCWFAIDGGVAPQCATDRLGSCQCAVIFDDDGFVTGQENISVDLLNIENF